MAVSKRRGTGEPLTEHDVAERFSHALLRVWRFALELADDDEMRTQVLASRFLAVLPGQVVEALQVLRPTPTAPMDAAAKVALLKEMGFERLGSDHTDDCPYVRDAGYRCNCIPPVSVWTPPKDVIEFIGETVEQRIQAAKLPRIIPEVERW